MNKKNKCCVQKRTGNQSNALNIKRMGKNTELDIKFEKIWKLLIFIIIFLVLFLFYFTSLAGIILFNNFILLLSI